MKEEKLGITNYARVSDDVELEKMEDLLAKDPESVPLLEWVAFMYYTSDKVIRAIELYEKLVRLDGGNESHYYYLGNLYLKTNQVQKAIDKWKKVVELAPTSKFAEKSRRLIEEHGSGE